MVAQSSTVRLRRIYKSENEKVRSIDRSRERESVCTDFFGGDGDLVGFFFSFLADEPHHLLDLIGNIGVVHLRREKNFQSPNNRRRREKSVQILMMMMMLDDDDDDDDEESFEIVLSYLVKSSYCNGPPIQICFFFPPPIRLGLEPSHLTCYSFYINKQIFIDLYPKNYEYLSK